MSKALFILVIVSVFIKMAQAQTPAPSPVASAVAPSPSPTASAVPTPTASPAGAAVTNPADALAGVIEDYSYAPEGKKDPFTPFDIYEAQVLEQGSQRGMGPVFPLQKYDLDQLKLVGIIWGVAQPKAMITDPTGRGHVIKVNDRMGRNNGYVARIREGEVVVIESFKGLDGRVTYQTKIMKLANE